jgi:hypothetical protein
MSDPKSTETCPPSGTKYVGARQPIVARQAVPHQFTLVSPNDLANYRGLMHTASKTHSQATLENRVPWHAATVIEALSRLAQEKQSDQQGEPKKQYKVDLITGSCDNYFYGGATAEMLTEFVNSGGTIRVLVFSSKFDPSTSQLYQKLSVGGKLHERASFRIAPGPTPDKVPHFMVACGQAYRLESEACNFHQGEFNDLSPVVEAKVCFNNAEIANSLHDYATLLWHYAELLTKTK